MVVASVNLSMFPIKVIYVGHLQWYIMRKSPRSWAILYGSGVLGMGHTIFARDRGKFAERTCPTHGTCFGRFMRGSKLWMVVVKNQELVVTSNMVKAMLMVWYT